MPIERVAIIGGGLCGWLAASMLARKVPDVQIIVLSAQGEERGLGIANGGEVLLPQDIETVAATGWRGGDLLKHCSASFVLGTAMSGWRGDGMPAFVPFGEIGAPLGPVPFHQLVAVARARGHAVNIANYALGALCAQSGRFAPPRGDDASVLATLAFGLTVDTGRLRDLLRADARRQGVTEAGMWTGGADREGTTITALHTAAGDGVDTDLIVDASGADSPLAGAFEGWAQWFPFDRAITALRPARSVPPLYTDLAALADGWQAFVPLAGGVAETVVSGSAQGPDVQSFRTGRQRRAWEGNLVRIGAAAAQHDPCAGLQLHLALADAARLVALFPANRDCRAEALEYDRQWRETSDCAFDYTALRLARNGAAGPVWDALRATDLPERTQYRHDLYAGTGRVVLHDGEVFETPGWVAQFEATGILPQRADALANALPTQAITAHLGKVREAMLAGLGRLPPHATLLAEMHA
ncbi:MAG: tryptophan 7-halogenase [Novosphingobium sp.]|nr:tryptophan 7-halogenase [Novosphingobium sp.]